MRIVSVRGIFTKAVEQGLLFDGLVPKKVARKDGVVQTYHTRSDAGAPAPPPDPPDDPPDDPPAQAAEPTVPYAHDGRVMYVLTDKDRERAKRDAAGAKDRKRATPAQRKEYALAALKGNPEYHRGLWQGRIDKARDLTRHPERPNEAYAHGYERGYDDYARDARGGLTIPAAYLRPISEYPAGTPPSAPTDPPRATRTTRAARPSGPPPLDPILITTTAPLPARWISMTHAVIPFALTPSDSAALLAEGRRVLVRAKSGNERELWITDVGEQTPTGTVVALSGTPPAGSRAARRHAAIAAEEAERARHDPPTPPPARRPVYDPTALVENATFFHTDRVPELNRVYTRHGSRPIVYTRYGKRARITDDDPSLHGSHLLGHEGSMGIYVHWRDATADEIATSPTTPPGGTMKKADDPGAYAHRSVRLTLTMPRGDVLAKSLGVSTRPTKVRRQDNVVQTYHKGRPPQQPDATKPQQATPPAPRLAQQPSAPSPTPGLPPKATGASVAAAAQRASAPKPVHHEDIPKPKHHGPDMAHFARVHAEHGEEGLLAAAKAHISKHFEDHRAHLDHIRDNYKAHVLDGHAIINMGLPASGKTSAAKQHALRHGQYLHLDVDNYKHYHPHYDPKAPQHVHGFSKQLEEHAFAEAQKHKLPVVLDTTGGNHKRWIGRIQKLRAAGYKHVGLSYAKVEQDEAKRRNMARERSVPESVIDGTLAEFRPDHPDNDGKTPLQHFMPHVDKVHVYDHRYETGRHGRTPYGKAHAEYDRHRGWQSFVAAERQTIARAKAMGKAIMVSLAGLFGRLPKRRTRYTTDGGQP
jgi:hypothetical protein